ncbi:MAG: hypothetical protein C5B51_16455 [Terriglobia bacterium]|nr:MAG: hypothetical protein C5B51_16455 [Terriglobia bacterium]
MFARFRFVPSVEVKSFGALTKCLRRGTKEENQLHRLLPAQLLVPNFLIGKVSSSSPGIAIDAKHAGQFITYVGGVPDVQQFAAVIQQVNSGAGRRRPNIGRIEEARRADDGPPFSNPPRTTQRRGSQRR